MMKPFTFQDDRDNEVTLFCRHGKTWPPIQAMLDEPPESLAARGVITNNKLLQVQTWRKVCGLREMGDKCKTCPEAMVGGKVRGKDQLVQYCPPESAGVGAPPLYRVEIKKGEKKKVARTFK